MKRKTKLGLVSVSAVVALSGCVEEQPIEPATVTAEETEVVKDETVVKEAEVKTMGVGDVIEFNGLKMTLNSVREDAGSEYLQPENGKYVVADMTIENTTDKEVSVSTLMNLSLKDADGYQYTIGIGADTKGSLDGTVAPGSLLRGEIAFDASDSESYELIYEEVLESGQAIWKFSL